MKYHELIFGRPNMSPKYQGIYPEEFEQLPDAQKDNYEYEKSTRTYKLDESLWKEQRKHWVYYMDARHPKYVPYTITGSEAGSIAVSDEHMRSLLVDTHAFKCKMELWYEKKGLPVPLAENSNEKARENLFLGGHLFEDVAAKALEIELQRKYPASVWEVRKCNNMYQCGMKNADGTLAAPWLIATPDALVFRDGECIAIAEFKNIQPFSPNVKLVKKNIVPGEYQCQISHYFMATGHELCFFVAVTGNAFPDDFRIKRVKKDEELCDALFEAEEKFIESLHKGVMPNIFEETQDTKKLYSFLRRVAGNFSEDSPVYEGDESLSEVIEELSFIEQDIDDFKEKLANLEMQKESLLSRHILPRIGRANEMHVPTGDGMYWKVLLKEKENLSLDELEIKKNEPMAYEESLETSFSVKLFKNKFPELYRKYAKPSLNITEKKKNFLKIRLCRKEEIA